MKRPTELLKRILLDVRLQLTDTIDRDVREIERRFEDEGMSFLTISLPRLDDALLQGLRRGYLTRYDFVGFKPLSRGGSLPALLSGFFRRVFRDDGVVLDEPDVRAIYAIRQVTRSWKRVELPCSDARVKAAYERYVSNDKEVDWRRHRDPLDTVLFRSICGYLWSDLELYSGDFYLSPGKFGPGATSERFLRNERTTIREWPERAESNFPSTFHAVSSEDSDSVNGLNYLTPEQERPVRVVQVPKTLKTPRTISVEPSYMMLLQQSIAVPLMIYLESKRFGFQSIRFSDQSVNRNLARIGSVDGSLATIDLKDASDMVDLDLVRHIFRGPCPTFLQFIEDCRTTKAQLPDGTILPLRKFASMGSALCFPIEAMVFFTIIMYALVKNSGRVPSRRLLVKLAKDVAVYGDDIIVPSSMAPVVMSTLEDFGLKVNHDKSFHTGLFRESCGGDYYNGVDVTPAYVRHWDDTGTLSKSISKVAYVSLSNTFYMKGLWNACEYLRDGVDLLLGPLPRARHPIGCLHYASFLYDDQLSYDRKLHGYRAKGFRIRSKKVEDSPGNLDGFLIASFGNGEFARLSRTRKKDLRKESAHWHVGYNYQRAFRALPSRERSRDGETLGHTDNLLLNEPGELPSYSYAEYAKNPLHFGVDYRAFKHKVDGRDLSHLRTAAGTSLYTSDRPHALCLKRGWTASQAGLDW